MNLISLFLPIILLILKIYDKGTQKSRNHLKIVVAGRVT